MGFVHGEGAWERGVHGAFEGEGEAEYGGFFGGLDGEGGGFEHVGSPFLRGGKEVGQFDDFVDHAVAVGFGGGEAFTGEDDAHGDVVGDLTREAVDAACASHEADAGFGQAEGGGFGGDEDVAGHGELEAAPEGEAVHGGDEGFVESPASVESAESAFEDAAGLADGVGAVFGLKLEVVAGGEGFVSGSGDDADPEVGVVLELGEGGVHFEGAGRVDGVHDFGAVDGEGHDMAGFFDGDEFVGHGRFS